jgi:secretion/DNA translocation related TadE-like protein
MTGRRCGRPAGAEAGSATVAGLTMLGLVVAFALTCAGVAGLFVAHRQAQSAADLGSLAGATAVQRGQPACAAAARIARRNGAVLTRCAVQGEVVTVRVAVASAPLLGRVRHTDASARAGPVTAGGEVRPW